MEGHRSDNADTPDPPGFGEIMQRLFVTEDLGRSLVILGSVTDSEIRIIAY